MKHTVDFTARELALLRDLKHLWEELHQQSPIDRGDLYDLMFARNRDLGHDFVLSISVALKLNTLSDADFLRLWSTLKDRYFTAASSSHSSHDISSL